MTREEVLRVLTGQVGPMGPFDSAEERDAQWDAWLAGVSDEAIEPLLSILRQPPVMRPDMWSDMELKVAEALGHLGQREPAGFVARVAPVLPEARPRPVLIDALGMAKAREALPVLSTLLDRVTLTEDELVRMAGALGAIGGAGAAKLLKRMEPLAKDKPEALAELGVAREILAYDRADQGVMAHHLAQALKALPNRAEASFLEHALALMEKDALRKPLIHLLGTVHSASGLGWLATQGNLLPAELALAAGYLAEASGPEARQVLRQVLPRAAGSPEALAAVEQAMANLREQPVSSQLETALAQSAACLERMDRGAYRQAVAALVSEPRSRRAWVTMLDGVQSAEGLAWMAGSLERAGAEDADWIPWLRALGAVGGAEAKVALEEFRASGLKHSAPVQGELEQAWESVQEA